MTTDSTNCNAAAVRDDTEPESGTPPVVEGANREAARYLIGFISPLSGLHVRFAQPLHRIHVCIVCGALRYCVKILRCGHMLCLFCRRDHLIKTTALPGGDGSATQVWCSMHQELRPASRSRSEVLQVERVRREIAFCPNSEHGCPFKAELGQVEEHYVDCCYRAPASP